ncbi:RagB/SusD domain-containing protein [Filimonas lacunae]|uniref:RagB/SusD domain-containing protein n=1 Tax=Filimonas lacunae TaxID=477680 RepID=A0A173MIS5_9BACT|nr:RagB/SusD family nutrient uptake outer membrane protein [Filimonas lacunae]BAV07366.1 outer membrane protein, nutrient binding [Filimonas lacunae]SIS90661.1 RagB/SusD domain-containing protein [Filimonas lacunae]
MKRIYLIAVAALSIAGSACNKYVDTPLPKTELVSELVFTTDKTATAAVVGVYSEMNGFNYQFPNVLVNFLPAMGADELYYYTTFATFDVFKNNALLPSSQYVLTMWTQPYYYIYNANACIEGLQAATGLTESLRKQLLGESYFLRAFYHFYLVNLYGDVPLITSTHYETTSLQPRAKTSQVYETIVSDLKQAKELMNDAYPSGNRVRPNKAVATAMLARVYLYLHQWQAAETEASEVISNNNYALLSNLNQVFLGNSKEALWQLQPVNISGGRNTWEGFTATPATATSTPLYRLDSTLAAAFEPGDARKANWTGSRTLSTGATVYFPYKYKIRTNTAGVTEYSMVMRLAEQYLVRAEARAQQDKLSDARADLDTLRHRALLTSLPETLDKDGVLLAVEQERRVELFTEWGHRWLDLKRTQRADAVLGARKGTNWQSKDTLYPIPADAIKSNPHLTQNDY